MTDLDKAILLADTADGITMKYYRAAGLHVTDKSDHTPVTQGDLETEQALSTIVHKEYGDNYLGEEGTRDTGGGRIWIVDPIDGTRNFMRGMPVWATLIALHEHGVCTAAVVSAPALGRRWWAAKGEGAWTKEVDGSIRKLQTSGVHELKDAFLLYASLFSWDEVPTGSPALIALLKKAWRHRALGDFLNYMLIAEGAADACFEANPKQWDLEAPKLIVSEAGGSFWTSAPQGAPADAPRIAIATNGQLEQSIRTSLKV